MKEQAADTIKTTMSKLSTLLDHVTDIVAITAIAGMVVYGYTPSGTVIGAITTIALGAKGAKAYKDVKLG